MGLDSTAAAATATTTTTERKSLTLPAGRISLKLPLGDRDARSQFLSLGTPASPTSASSTEPLSLPFSHKNPNHAVNAFNALNQMRANNEVGGMRNFTMNEGSCQLLLAGFCNSHR